MHPMHGLADAPPGTGPATASSVPMMPPSPAMSYPRHASAPPSGLFQTCTQLAKRLGCVYGFEHELPRTWARPGTDAFDPVSDLWHFFRLGKPLCMLFNVYATYMRWPPISYTTELRLSNANMCKALVMRFILALKERLGWDPDDTFTVSQLYLNDTNGFVRVVRTVDRLVTLLEERGLVHLHTPHPYDTPEQFIRTAPPDQRELVSRELLESERKYVGDLEILQAYASALSQYDLVSQDTLHHIFGNLDQLVDAQRRFLICLEQNAQKPADKQLLSGIFRALEDDFSVYDLFCANYAHALHHINDERSALAALAQIPAAQSRYLEPTYELPTYLIKPVQRICKYPLLLEQLLKHTPELERADLIDALTIIRRITDRVNETRRAQENEQLVQNLESRVEDWKGHSLQTFGPLLLCDSFIVSKGDSEREFCVYLFEHILLCCKDTSHAMPSRTRSKSSTRLRPRGGSVSESSRRQERLSAPLQLKGRIFLSNMVGIQALGRQADAYILQVWWHGELDIESFCLKCKNEEQLRIWHSTLQRQLDEIRQRRETVAARQRSAMTPMTPHLPADVPSRAPCTASSLSIRTPSVSECDSPREMYVPDDVSPSPHKVWRQMSLGHPPHMSPCPLPMRSSSVSGQAHPEFLEKELEAMRIGRTPTRHRGLAAARGGPPPMHLDMTAMQRTASDSMAMRSFMSPLGTATPADWHPTPITLPNVPVSPKSEWNPYFGAAPEPSLRHTSISTAGSRRSGEPAAPTPASPRHNSGSGASATSGSAWLRSAPHSPALGASSVMVHVRRGTEHIDVALPSAVRFGELHAHVHRRMRLDPHARMYHIDEDGDRVMLLDDDDLATAMDHVHRHPDPHLLLVIE